MRLRAICADESLQLRVEFSSLPSFGAGMPGMAPPEFRPRLFAIAPAVGKML